MIDVASSSLCLITGPLCQLDPLPAVGSALTKGAADVLMDVFASSLAAAAGWLVAHVVAVVEQTTTPDLTSSWYERNWQAMEAVVAVVVLPVLLAASLGAVVRQDLRRVGRIWAVGLPVAILAGMGGTAFAQLGLQATDQMCAVLTNSMGTSESGELTTVVTGVGSSGAPDVVKMIVFALMITGAVLIWLELLVRMSAVYLAVLFMPLALVGFVWPLTAHMAKRAVELLAALILSKFVIVAALMLGLSALAGPTPSPVDGAITGSAVLLLTAFAPFCLLRLAPVVETAAIAHLEGLSRRPLHATSRAVTSASSAVVPAARMLLSAVGRSGTGPTGGVGPTPVAAQPLPERKADYPLRSPIGGVDG